VSKKLFSLIYDKAVHQAPNVKIIDADSFSELISSQELLKKIKEEAEQYRKEVVQECEGIKEAARREGFEEGYQAWVKQIAGLEEEITRVQGEMQKLVMPIALKAAKKIIVAELASSPQIIVDIVMHAMKSVAQHKKIVLYVNKADFEYIDSNKSKIKQLFESLESLSVRERDDVEPGGCVIETESGIINAQFKERWRTLEAAFEALGSEIKKK
jgi:type III secretion protein L